MRKILKIFAVVTTLSLIYWLASVVMIHINYSINDRVELINMYPSAIKKAILLETKYNTYE